MQGVFQRSQSRKLRTSQNSVAGAAKQYLGLLKEGFFMIDIQSGRKSDGARRARLNRVICETLERSQLFNGLPTPNNVADLTAVTSTGAVVTTDSALQGPIQFPFANGQPKEAVTQPDGKRLVAGYAGGNWAIARYNTDGSLDPTFGGGDGKSVNDLGSASDCALNISLRPDGKIILLGVTAGSGDNWQFAAIRLNSDGMLDATFGDNGKLLSGLGRAPTYGGVSTVLKDGRIHMTGWDGNRSKGMEYDSDGQNGFDRLDKTIAPLHAESLLSAPARPEEGTLAYFAQGESIGPEAPQTMPMYANEIPTVDEGSDYPLPLSKGDGWSIKWDQNDDSSESVAGHPDSYSHAYPDGPASHTISATSKTIYLQDNETLAPDTSGHVVEADGLSMSAGSALDLKDNDLIVASGNFSTLQSLVLGGYRGGPDTTATGIVSSTSQNVHASTTRLSDRRIIRSEAATPLTLRPLSASTRTSATPTSAVTSLPRTIRRLIPILERPSIPVSLGFMVTPTLTGLWIQPITKGSTRRLAWDRVIRCRQPRCMIHRCA
jgi:uncharacterized delta-60 repeat protein